MAEIIFFDEARNRLLERGIRLTPKPVWWGRVRYKLRCEKPEGQYLRFLPNNPAEEILVTPPIFVEAGEKEDAYKKIISIFQKEHSDIVQYFLDTSVFGQKPPYQVVISRMSAGRKTV